MPAWAVGRQATYRPAAQRTGRRLFALSLPAIRKLRQLYESCAAPKLPRVRTVKSLAGLPLGLLARRCRLSARAIWGRRECIQTTWLESRQRPRRRVQ